MIYKKKARQKEILKQVQIEPTTHMLKGSFYTTMYIIFNSVLTKWTHIQLPDIMRLWMQPESGEDSAEVFVDLNQVFMLAVVNIKPRLLRDCIYAMVSIKADVPLENVMNKDPAYHDRVTKIKKEIKRKELSLLAAKYDKESEIIDVLNELDLLTVDTEILKETFRQKNYLFLESFFNTQIKGTQTDLSALNEVLNTQDLIPFFKCLVVQEKFTSANSFLIHLQSHAELFSVQIDLLIKTILLMSDAKYLTSLLTKEHLCNIFDSFQSVQNFNILHFAVQNHNSEVIECIFEKYKECLCKPNYRGHSPLDILITQQTNNTYIHDLDFIEKLIYAGLDNPPLIMNHKSFVTLCRRENRREGIIFLKYLWEKFDFSDAYGEDDTNSSLSILIEKRRESDGAWFFENSFLASLVVDSKSKNFFGFLLEHSSFQALCERDNADLMKICLEKMNFDQKRYHNFDTCFASFIKNENKSIAQLVLKHLETKWSLVLLIDYILKYIDLAATKYDTPEWSVYFVNYLNNLKDESVDWLKKIIIQTIFKVDSLQHVEKLLLDEIETYCSLDQGETLFHFFAKNCNSEKKLDVLKNFINNTNQINTVFEEKTPLDILIQKKSSKSTGNFATNFIFQTLLASNIEAKEEVSLKTAINKLENDRVKDLIRKVLIRSNELFISYRSEFVSQFFCFSSTFLKNILEDQATQSGTFTISYQSFKAICERNDSRRDMIFLVESLIEKVRQKETEFESPMHFLITNKTEAGKYIFSEYCLKKLIDKQSTSFEIKLNAQSFTDLCGRKDLNLLKMIVERAKFDTSNEACSSLDTLIKDEQFSNQFIKQIKSTSDLFNQSISLESLSALFNRNDINLMKKLIKKKHLNVFVENKSKFYDFRQIFCDNHNTDLANYIFECMLTENECTNDLCSNINLYMCLYRKIESAILNGKLKMSDCVLECAKRLINKGCVHKNCYKIGLIFIAISDALEEEAKEKFHKFISHLIENKRSTQFFYESINDSIKECKNQNYLHHLAQTSNHTLFVAVLNSQKDFLNELNSDNESPLDLLLTSSNNTPKEAQIIILQEIAFKTPIKFSCKMTQNTFEYTCVLLNNPKYVFMLKALMGKIKFTLYSHKQPLTDFLITEKKTQSLSLSENPAFVFENTFINQIAFETSMLSSTLSAASFMSLCDRNDSELFKLLVDSAKFVTDIPFDECLVKFISKTNLDFKLVEHFLDFIQEKNKVTHNSFTSLNQLINKSIKNKDYKLAGYVLDYFKARVQQENNPYGDKVNQNLVDIDTFKFLSQNECWDLIEKVLDCSNLSTAYEKKFCFTYFDYKFTEDTSSNNSSTTTSQNSGYTCINCTDLNDGHYEKLSFKKHKDHPLFLIAQSGQKSLKDHPTTIKLMELKWRRIPRFIYWIITLLQLSYLIVYSVFIYHKIIESEANEKDWVENIKIGSEYKIFLTGLWILFLIYEVLQWLGLFVFD